MRRAKTGEPPEVDQRTRAEVKTFEKIAKAFENLFMGDKDKVPFAGKGLTYTPAPTKPGPSVIPKRLDLLGPLVASPSMDNLQAPLDDQRGNGSHAGDTGDTHDQQEGEEDTEDQEDEDYMDGSPVPSVHSADRGNTDRGFNSGGNNPGENNPGGNRQNNQPPPLKILADKGIFVLGVHRRAQMATEHRGSITY